MAKSSHILIKVATILNFEQTPAPEITPVASGTLVPLDLFKSIPKRLALMNMSRNWTESLGHLAGRKSNFTPDRQTERQTTMRIHRENPKNEWKKEKIVACSSLSCDKIMFSGLYVIES